MFPSVHALWIHSSGLNPQRGAFIPASWEGGFCGMTELEPPSHSIEDILDAVSPHSSSKLTVGYQRTGGVGLPPSLPHTWCPCCHRRLIQQDVDAFPVGSVNWSKSPSGHVIANARTGARPGRKKEWDQHFGSRLQLSWIKHSTKLYSKKLITSRWFSFGNNTPEWQVLLGGIHMFIYSTDEYNNFRQYKILHVTAGI